MTFDDALERTLSALADMPSGPPAEEILAVIQAAAWDEGSAWTNDSGAYVGDENPYRGKS